jgi:succinate dehydrogenase / fumarate reductase, iron-sulfur subunit
MTRASSEQHVRRLVMRVWRGNGSGGSFQDFKTELVQGEVVLDVLHRIQASLAPDLAIRWNCKAGRCGSCSAEINGRPRLMCMTRIDSLPAGEPVTVGPMQAFPVVRDLVTDVSFNYEMARRVPAFSPKADAPTTGYRMSQHEIDRPREFRKCIECFLCQDVCHVIRDHEENKTYYAGPRFFIRYAELEMHPLDNGDRAPLLHGPMGLAYCNITKCCTEVCPEHIHITDNAIIPLKERVVSRYYDPVTLLRNRLHHRKARASTTHPSA